MTTDARNIEVRPTTLQNLVAEVANGNFRIPRFQRNYVWPPKKVLELFDSMYREFPIGSFFLWKAGRGHAHLFRQAGSLGIKAVANDDDVTFILDGQQRITSLYATLNGLTIGSHDYANICFDLVDERFVSRKVESRVRYIPVCEVWSGNVLEISRKLEKEEHFKRLDKLYSGLRNYPISLVEVKNKDLIDVCGIFQRINQSGKRLDRFDLITATTFTEGFDLRERFQEDLIAPLKDASFGEVAPTSATQLLALVTKGGCTESNEFDLKTEDVQEAWPKCAKAFLLAADLLRKNMGVMEAKYLPYEAIFTLLAYFFVISGAKQPDVQQMEWIRNWFWRSTFGTRYGSAVASTMTRDRELFDLLQEGTPPMFSQRVELEVDDLIRTKMTSTRSAIRNGFLCMLAAKRPINLAQNTELDLTGITISSLTEKQKHHIFPWAHLKGEGTAVAQVHAIPNFCFLPADLNKHISANKPSKYFVELEKENPKVSEALQRSLIPKPADSGIESDNYPKFLECRARLLLEEIQRLCGHLDRPAERERTMRLGGIELAFRDHIHDVLYREVGENYWKQAMPPDVMEGALNMAKRESGVSGSNDISQRRLFDFCFLSDYEKIISRNWCHFENTFGRKEEFRHYMRSINEFRNHVMHFKPLEGLVAAEGEMAVIWLEATLPSFQDPAQRREDELSEEDFDDDDEEIEAWSDQQSWEWWEKKSTRKVLKVTGKLIELVTSLSSNIKPQFLQGYIGFALDGTGNNFVIMFPKRAWVRVGVRVQDSKADVEMIEKAGLEMMPYNSKHRRIRFRVRENDLPGAIPVIEGLAARAYEAASSSRSTGERGKFQWDETSFMARIRQQDGPELNDVAKALLAWCQENADKIRWGRSQEDGDGSFTPKFLLDGKKFSPFAVRTGNGPGKTSVHMYFGNMKRFPPYETEGARLNVMARLNELSGVDLDESKIGKYPNMSMAVFKNGSVLEAFFCNPPGN